MPTFASAKCAHDRAEEVGCGTKSASKIGDQLALGDLEAVVEGAGLVARAVDAVDVHRVDAATPELLDLRAREVASRRCESSSTWISRPLARVVHLRDGLSSRRSARRARCRAAAGW
jgi:hypothetical protein